MKKLIELCFSMILILCAISLYAQSQFSWKVLPNAPTSPVRFEDVYFISPLTGWIISTVSTSSGQTPNLYKTTDGGDSWINLSDTSIGYPRCIGFANSQIGWLGTYLVTHDTVGIYKTTNGGENWFPQLVGHNIDSFGVCGMNVLDENNVIACGRWYAPAKFYKTSNSGINWTVKDMNGYATRLIDCYFVSPDTGFLVGGIGTEDSSKGVVLFTSDGGATWVTKYTTITKGHWGWKISFPSKDTGYVSLQRSIVPGSSYFLKTTDGGNTWAEKTIINGFLSEEGIGFINNNTGWLGGWYMHIYKTTNGGNNWTFQTWAENVNRFRFFGDTLGYAVGEKVYKYMKDSTSNINQTSNEIPDKPDLSQNYPNPFNPSTVIKFLVVDYDYTKLTIFDVLGREVAVLIDQRLYPGTYEYTFDATGLESGVYFYRIQTLHYTETKKMILLK